MLDDFNEIKGDNEKIGGPLRDDNDFRDFRTMISNCDMSDIKHKENRFSWSGQLITIHTGSRIKETIQCCLDRIMANSAWTAMFPASETIFLEPISYDHRPLIFTIEKQTILRQGQFHFDNRLIHNNRIEEIIKVGWNSGT